MNRKIADGLPLLFQHTAARRRLILDDLHKADEARFNTQPPEGGCYGLGLPKLTANRFNTQPPEGGWLIS